MADEAKPQETADDRVANLQAEFNRKLENQSAEVKKLADTNAALAQQLRALAPKPPTPKVKPLDQTFYENPEEHARIIREQAKVEVLAEIDARNANQSKVNNVINQLGQQYPELQDNDSEFSKKTLAIFGAMEESEKKDPKAIRIAALEAAQELGLKPRNKRSEEENFALSGGNGNRPRQGGKSDKLDQRTEDLAALMGINLQDKKKADSLKSRAKRSNYRNYQSNK